MPHPEISTVEVPWAQQTRVLWSLPAVAGTLYRIIAPHVIFPQYAVNKEQWRNNEETMTMKEQWRNNENNFSDVFKYTHTYIYVNIVIQGQESRGPVLQWFKLLEHLPRRSKKHNVGGCYAVWQSLGMWPELWHWLCFSALTFGKCEPWRVPNAMLRGLRGQNAFVHSTGAVLVVQHRWVRRRVWVLVSSRWKALNIRHV